MGHVRDPVLRPPRSPRGLRPPARGGGAASRTVARALLVAIALVSLSPSIALADTVGVTEYRARLAQVRDALVLARASAASVRGPLVANAQILLRRTDRLTLADGGSIAIDDSLLASGIDATDAGLDSAIARLGTTITLAARIGAPSVDAAVADARLREVIAKTPTPASDGNLLDALFDVVRRFLAGLEGPGVDFGQLYPALGLLGVTVALFIVAVLGRALPQRIRREVLVGGASGEERIDPALHLRAAEAAIGASRAREAIHSLYLYAILTLADREVIRYDPALTDRELILRAAAIPHAAAFRDLIESYERSWFGLREPSIDEARRVRELAVRVAQ